MSAALDPIRIRRPRGDRALVASLIGVIVLIGAAAGVGYLVLSGALDGRWYDFRDLGVPMAHLTAWLDEQNAHQSPATRALLGDHWMSYLTSAVIGGVGILSFVGGVLLILIWVERRLIARIQVRRGPNRLGPYGLLQPLADAIKLIQKEVLIPEGADRFLFFLPPILVFIPGLLVWGPVPWAPNMAYLDLNVGVLYLIAISSLATIAIFIAGWSSNNHYALLGAMRTVAMMISYEIPLAMALISVVLLAGSMQLSEIVRWQAEHYAWMAFLIPFSLFTFFFSSTAELNRTPNDIAEAESEIVAGFHTEYSGMKFGLFYAVELGNAVAVAAFVTAFFLGGWSLFGLEAFIPGYLIYATKVAAGYFVLVWLRGTLPRFRLDQLMAFAWKYLIPIAIAHTVLVAAEVTAMNALALPGVVELGAVALINIVFTVWVMRRWARFLGYRPEGERALQPQLATEMGGLRAAERMRVSS